jgi:hypothetical protein
MKNIATKKPIEVVHIDNCIDMNFFHLPVLPKDENKVVIGWGGSNTHGGDIGLVWGLLPQLLKDFPQVYLEFVGHEPPAEIRSHPRVKILPWCHISEYHNRFAHWNWDIVLAPLEKHRFNKSKSCIKMQEAAAIKAPCLAQWIEPYKYFCSFDKQLMWLLCDDLDWKTKLHRLIEDAPYRKQLGEAMYQNILANFNIERSAREWQSLSSSLL